MKKAIVSTAVVVAVVLVAAFVPLVNAEFRHTETYLADEPYEATETYTATLPLSYEVSESYVYESTYTYSYQTNIGGLIGEGTREVPIKVAAVVVKNTDEIAGSVAVSFSGFPTLLFSSAELFLAPGETKTASCPADTDEIGDWSYTTKPGMNEVERERTVTKYRQVEKERLVTRYERVPIFEYLFG